MLGEWYLPSGFYGKIPETEGLRQQDISRGSGGRELKVKVPADLVSGESQLPGLSVAPFSLCPHTAFPW